jgi:hypothetical protein
MNDQWELAEQKLADEINDQGGLLKQLVGELNNQWQVS